MAKLRVRFTGLFLFARHPVEAGNEEKGLQGVTVLAVDARRTIDPSTDKPTLPRYPDGKDADPHVGLIRIPSRYLAGGGPASEPAIGDEVILKLDREEIGLDGVAWGGGVSVPKSVQRTTAIPGVPKLEAFADLSLDPGCLSDPPNHPRLLTRFRLAGGSFPVQELGTRWLKDMRQGKKGHVEVDITNRIVWDIDVAQERDGVSLFLVPFGGGPGRTVDLRPVEDEIVIDVMNICGHNPLRWTELAEGKSSAKDIDFKLHYWLLSPAMGPLSVPVLLPGHPGDGRPFQCMVLSVLMALRMAFAPLSPPANTTISAPDQPRAEQPVARTEAPEVRGASKRGTPKEGRKP